MVATSGDDLHINVGFQDSGCRLYHPVVKYTRINLQNFRKIFLYLKNEAYVGQLEKAIIFLGKFGKGLACLHIDCSGLKIKSLHLTHQIVDMRSTQVSIETAFLAIKQFQRKVSKTGQHQLQYCFLNFLATDMRRYSVRKHYTAVAYKTNFTPMCFSTNDSPEELSLVKFFYLVRKK